MLNATDNGKQLHIFGQFPYNSRMTRRFGLIYTIFSILVLTVLTVLAIGRLSSARTANLDEAQSSYQRLRAQLVEAGAAPPVSNALREYATVVPTVQSLVLFDPDRGLRYVWTADNGILAIDRDAFDSFRGFPDYRLNDVRQIRFRDDVAEDFYLDAVYRVLSFEDAYIPLRDSLIALLGFAFVTVLIVLALGHSGSTRVGPEEAPTTHSTPSPEVEPVISSAATPETHDHRPAGAANAEDFAYEEISIDELATEPGEPGTLFNPVTGLSHHDHLERRLGLELERSAYNDQDLVCLLVRFAELSGPEEYVERAKQILSAFQFADLCFEYDDSAFCVVLPNTELPQGLRQAESFHKRHPECHIGLSARNGRLVEARRLLTETERSLSHAATDSARVVGFRPDPRKYRQFVTRQMSVDE